MSEVGALCCRDGCDAACFTQCAWSPLLMLISLSIGPFELLEGSRSPGTGLSTFSVGWLVIASGGVAGRALVKTGFLLCCAIPLSAHQVYDAFRVVAPCPLVHYCSRCVARADPESDAGSISWALGSG
mmetsp:Transcript_45888/g.103975  ORF Transcript_45888/g.103975 Transcript_45888/m.103975 type:complete len:128 (+) Transcript_45888:1137-1520(+)